jgi:hypothetical protein
MAQLEVPLAVREAARLASGFGVPMMLESRPSRPTGSGTSLI